MRILQINSVIDRGSTGRITRDLYDYLESQGHECVIAFGRGETVPGYKTIQFGSSLEQMSHLIYSRLTDRHGFASHAATRKLIREIKKYKPDLIQLHNIHGYYLNIKTLFNYFAEADIPIVWLLHDQWAISGHSANFNLNADGSLPTKLPDREELKYYPKTLGFSQFDRNLKDKERIFTSLNNMTLLTPSNWLTDMMKKSFLNKYEIRTIYNGVDTDVFRIEDANVETLKKEWGAHCTQHPIVLGVASDWTKESKGIHDFIQLSQLLPRSECQIVLVGVDVETRSRLPNTIIPISSTDSVEELRDIYNASDVFVNPTYLDNFPTVNIEALACGTPVITYDTGGSPEAVNKKTGSVVPQGDLDSLIQQIIQWGNKTEEISQACRQHVMTHFTKESAYSKYEQLYTDLLEGGSSVAIY